MKQSYETKYSAYMCVCVRAREGGHEMFACAHYLSATNPARAKTRDSEQENKRTRQ